MNVQIEHIDNHTARLTVEIEEAQLNDAKVKAARKISQKYTIPGFRKGKAPYNIIVKTFGEATILEEAVEELGQETYRVALEQSGIEPYGPGSLDDVKFDPLPVFVYTVPKVPTVNLSDYRAVRVPYELPTVEEKHVEQELERMRMDKGSYAEKTEAAALGDRVVIDVHSFIDNGEESAENAEEHDHEHDHDHDDHDHDDDSVIHDPKYQKGESYIHEHDAQVMLLEGDNEPMGPGFTQAMLGVSVGEVREFVLEYPDNDEINPDVRGKKVSFVAQVKKIESSQLPELDDAFAATFTEQYGEKATEGEEAQPLTLEQLRVKLHESIERELKTRYEDQYANNVLDQIVEQAEVKYPVELVNDEINNLVEYLDDNLKAQGASLEVYKQITGMSDEDLRENYRETAQKRVRRSLVFTEIVETEGVGITNEEIDAKIEELARQYTSDESQLQSLRDTFRSPNFLSSIVNRLGEEKTFARIAAIGRGEAPELTAPATTEGKEAESEPVESTDADSTENTEASGEENA